MPFILEMYSVNEIIVVTLLTLLLQRGRNFDKLIFIHCDKMVVVMIGGSNMRLIIVIIIIYRLIVNKLSSYITVIQAPIR